MKIANILNGSEVLILANDEFAVSWDLNETLKVYSIATWEAIEDTHSIPKDSSMKNGPELHHAVKEAKWLFDFASKCV